MKEPLTMEGKPLLCSIINAFDDAACLLDETGAVCCMNSAAEDLTGYRQEELVGGPFLPHVEITQPRADPNSSAEPSSSRPAAFIWKTVRLRRRDGSKMEVRCGLSSLGPTGAGPTLLKFRAHASEPIGGGFFEGMKAQLHAIFDSMSDGLIVISEVGEIQLFSSGAEKLFGYSRDEVLGQNVKILMPSPYQEAHDGYLAAYRKTGAKKIIGVGREVFGKRKDGVSFPIYLSIGEIWLDAHRFFVGVTHDLSRLKQAEQQLVTLSAAVDQSPAAVLISDKDGRIEYVNRSFSRLTGYGADEIIGQNTRLLRSNHTTMERHRRLWRTIRSGHEWRGEIQDRKKCGKLYWALETITPLRDVQGETTHYLAIQQDITEQKRDKEALAESEERFRQVADMAGEWLWEQDSKGHYTYSSAAVQNIIGFTPEEILGKSYLELLVADRQEHWMTALRDMPENSTQPFYHLVNHYRHNDGHDVYTESTGSPIFDGQGKLVKWRGVDHDITARKIFEDALRVRDRAIESVHIGIVISDAQAAGYPNIYVNPALCRITGYARDELLGRSMSLLQGPDTDPAALNQIRQALKEGQSCEVTLKNYRKGGSAFWNELLISPVVDDVGKLTHYIGIQTDVTERRRAEESRHELEIAKNIQLSLLPSAPLRVPRAELAGLCVPASHVGGDYFDFFQSFGVVDAVIADVSGHSVGAALVMTEVRSTLRAETRKASVIPLGPAQVLRDLNELLHDDLSKAELFITMFYLKFLPETRTLKFANAGHNLALLLRSSDAACTQLDSEGLVLGVQRAVEFEEKSVELSAGDKILLYTDGITDAENPRGDFFSVDRLSRSFIAHRSLAPEALVKQLLAEVRDFCGAAPLRDDVSMVMMQVC
jgi:sigma-B regulation protein RsbU (phosphoserine phosphatase)